MDHKWQTFSEFLTDLKNRYANKTALSIYQDNGWNTCTFEQLEQRSKLVAKKLHYTGLRYDDHVAILSESSIIWPIYMFGALLNGAIVVPLDIKLSEQELTQIMLHVEPRILLVSKKFLNTAINLRENCSSIEKILILEEEQNTIIHYPNVNLKDRTLQDTAFICYTSGTGGEPKGVMIGTETVLFELSTTLSLQENNNHDVIYSILPLNHLYGLTAGIFYSLACGAEYCMAHSLVPQDILLALKERKVTQISAVPLLLNLIKRGIERKIAENTSKLKRIVFKSALFIAPHLPLSIRKIIFSQIHKKLGNSVRRIVSGAAPLEPSTYDFFKAIGIPIFEGYGLTETGPVISVNTTKNYKKGTVGRILPGIELKIVENEIYTAGPHVMAGYYKNDQLTKEVLSEGWFKTGDLGYIDSKGYLHITGRKKSLIVLESGKKVQPEEVESNIAISPLFQDVCVLGLPNSGQGEQVCCVVLPTKELLQKYADNFAVLEKLVFSEIQSLIKTLAPFKQPNKIFVRRNAFPKTSSEKIKRYKVLEEILDL